MKLNEVVHMLGAKCVFCFLPKERIRFLTISMAHFVCSKRTFPNRDTHIIDENRILFGIIDEQGRRILIFVDFRCFYSHYWLVAYTAYKGHRFGRKKYVGKTLCDFNNSAFLKFNKYGGFFLQTCVLLCGSSLAHQKQNGSARRIPAQG